MQLAIVSAAPSRTTLALAATCLPDVEIVPMTPSVAASSLGPGDAVLGRLDVRQTLDGIDVGLWALGVLAARGVTVLNGPATLIATHDKLVTARVLRRVGLPHPWTRHLRPGRPLEDLHAPVVVKPRHGSWGRNVVVCETDESLAAVLEALGGEAWYVEHGALVQEVVPPTGWDLRVIVAGDCVVGAVRREAAPGDGGRTSRSAPDVCRSRRRLPPRSSRSRRRARPRRRSSESTSFRPRTAATRSSR